MASDMLLRALGTATTPFHIAKLMRQTDEIVFCFDGDNAGLKAAWRAGDECVASFNRWFETELFVFAIRA
jgi:hypothetical protein